MRTAINNNGVKNKYDKVLSNYTVHSITAVEVLGNQSKRNQPVTDKIRRKKTYAEMLKTERDKDDKLEQKEERRSS